MLDVTVTTVTSLHLGPSGLLAALMALLGTRRTWKYRQDLAMVATALGRRFLPDGRQEAAERLPGPSKPLTVLDPERTSRRLP